MARHRQLANRATCLDYDIAEGSLLRQGYLNIHQGRILLGAENVRIAGTAAGAGAIKGEFDSKAGGEFHKIGDTLFLNTIEAGNRASAQNAAVADQVEIGLISKDNIEGNLIDAGILRADGFGNIHQFF